MTVAWSGPVMAEADSNGDAPLPPHTATYEVLRRGTKIGEIHVSLSQRDDGIWYYSTETEATHRLARLLRLSGEESAHFVWRDNRILMLTYHQVLRTPRGTEFWQHRLDWDDGLVKTHSSEGDFTHEIEPDMVDPLSLRLQLAVNLHDPDQRSEDHHFRLIDEDELDDESFVYGGEEQLQIPAGCFDSLYLERVQRPDSVRTNTSWHSENFHWMPLRILQTRKGRNELDVRLLETSIELGDTGCD